MRRREALAFLAMGSLMAVRSGATSEAPDPPLWLIERDRAKVFLFPLGDAKDRSWLTPRIERSLRGSREVWFESLHPDPKEKATVTQTLASSREADDDQHSLFDILGPQRTARLLAAARKVGLQPADLEHKRPWAAYFVLNGAYWAQRGKQGLGTMMESPDYVLADMARTAGIPLHAEYPTNAAVMELLVSMPVEVQCQRLEYLLDYFDDEASGKHANAYGWITGHPDPINLDLMRLRYPQLYQIEQAQRNLRWADRIAGFLQTGGVYFIGMGLNHTLGPDSILVKVRSKGLVVRAV